MRAIDLSQPFCIERRAARSYLRLYGQVLARKAAGEPIRPQGDEGERLRQSSPVYRGLKNVEKRSGEFLPSGVVDRWGQPLTYSWSFREGVATLDVIGPIIRHGDFFSALSGLTSTGEIARQLEEALVHPDVQAIIFNFDSPGGEATGIAELAEQIHQAAGRKPVVAYGDGMVCSAAYWLASACNEIVLSPTGIAGSIGTLLGWMDDSKQLEAEGLEWIEFVSSESPEKNPDPKSKQGRAQYQQLVDDMTQVFGEAVARYRGVPLQTVWNNYGRGGVMVGRRAVRAGMVDRLGDYESLLAELSAHGSQRAGRHAPKPAATAAKTAATPTLRSCTGDNKMVTQETPTPSEAQETPDETGEETPEETSAPKLEEPDESESAVEGEPAAEGEAAEGQPPGGSEPAPAANSALATSGAPSSEVERLKAELAKAQAQLQSNQAALAQAQAQQAAQEREAFAALLGGRLPPVAHDLFTTLFGALQAGQGSAAQLHAALEALPAHPAFTQMERPSAPLSRLPAPHQNEEEARAARRQELLQTTPLGREVAKTKAATKALSLIGVNKTSGAGSAEGAGA